MNRREDVMIPLAEVLQTTAATIKTCHLCGNFDHQDPCRICTDPARDTKILCVVATVADLWAIERTKSFKGLYHILGGVLSALDGVGPDQLRLKELPARIKSLEPNEVILALSATMDGQTTAHVVSDLILKESLPNPPKITRLAHGVPVGGELDYLDDGTIITALRSRAGV
jgi:recombination protein RecR